MIASSKKDLKYISVSMLKLAWSFIFLQQFMGFVECLRNFRRVLLYILFILYKRLAYLEHNYQNIPKDSQDLQVKSQYSLTLWVVELKDKFQMSSFIVKLLLKGLTP